MKTVEDYLNDPRIINNPAEMMADEPVRRIHAIRLKQYDETKDMSPLDRIKYDNQRAEAILASLGMSLCYDFVGTGKRG